MCEFKITGFNPTIYVFLFSFSFLCDQSGVILQGKEINLPRDIFSHKTFNCFSIHITT